MPSIPTRLVLDVRAEYIPDGDSVLVVVFLQDPDLETGYPNYVKSGTLSLVHNGTAIREIDFDRRFGNGAGAEGDFIFQFSRPPLTSSMSVEVSMEIFPLDAGPASNIMRAVAPVTRSDTPYIPLEPQLDAGLNDELRSVKRAEEEV